MNLKSLDKIRDLAARREQEALSIYLPTETAGPQTRKSPILFKNLFKQASEELERMRTDGAAALLEQLEKSCRPLLDDHDFWQEQTSGLAVLCSAESCVREHLPLAPPAGVFLGRRFHLKPLLRQNRRDRRFFVLALSANRCRLFEGDIRSLESVDVPSMPDSLEHALRFDDPEKSLQYHSTGTEGQGQPTYHGQGSSVDSAEDRLLRYFQICAKALDDFLPKDGAAPLILATVEEHAPVFQQASSYSGLVKDELLAGNPDDSSAEELHSRAWPLVEAFAEKEEEEVLERCREQAAHSKGSFEIRDIGPAIKQGRVQAVVVAGDQTVPGSWNPTSGEVQLDADDSDNAPNEDVLNEIAAETLLHGGETYVISSDKLPEPSSGAAAIYRY